ncbi:hypothetical protein [Sinorhizobium meliloti]|uniref:hypothetical protein n=1 Tax=Rhizobium meliloti TaxID=382 RepID=UPI000FD7EDE5|nr:hypothetical protein [Sinorhizobium meliloti]RVJ40565.1 hypothetical protein CN175_33565 [Sinorhizobium meliloti]
MYRYTAFAALCLMAGNAYAGELKPLQGGSIDLGAFHGVVYYTEGVRGYQVVTTIAESAAGSPVRCEATLDEGQSLTISAPGGLNEPSKALEISRAGGRLFVTRIDTAPKLVRAGQ